MGVVIPKRSKLRVCLYGVPKSGKTRLATSLPWDDGEFWGKKWAYIAADPGSESLASVLDENVEHLVVWQPTMRYKNKAGKSYTLENAQKLPPLEFAKLDAFMDPHTDAHEAASKNWAGVDPEINGIIWDTMTETSEQLLRAYANTGIFSGDKGDKHISVGSQEDGSYMALPMMGDYGTTQLTVLQLVNLLFAQPLHVIVICHAGISVPDKDSIGLELTQGGPATVGQAGIEKLARKFDNLFRMEKKTIGGTKPTYKVMTEGKGIWLGGMRTHDKTNPMPEYIVGGDKANDGVDFWRTTREIQYGVA